jgi:small subunit ribosomal protein S20
MPVTTSAKKALRRDKRRTLINKPVRSKMKSAIQKTNEDPNPENISAAYSAIDRASKKRVIHANKADRIKSRLKHNAKKISSK